MPQLQFDTLPALASIVSQFANAALLGKFLLATVLAGLRCNSATVEVMVCNENGLEVFGGCAASVTGRVSSPTPYGTDLRREPIEVRKATFANLLRLASRYVSGRSKAWLKFKNPAAPAVKRETEED